MMAKSVIEKASERVLHHFQFPTGPQLDLDTLAEMKNAAGPTPILPCGLIIMVRTKDKASLLHRVTDQVINALDATKLVDVQCIRQMMVERQSSFDEIVDVFIVGLTD